MQKSSDKGKHKKARSKVKASATKKTSKKTSSKSWQSDIETRRYYYDDACNYQVYNDEED